MSTGYTSAELTARALELLPQPAVVNRTGSTDVDDLLDGVKERIARALYADVDGLFYLVNLTVKEIRQLLAEITVASANISTYVTNVRTPMAAYTAMPQVDAYAAVASLATMTSSEQAQLLKQLNAAVTTTAAQIRSTTGSTDITIPTEVATERLRIALDAYTRLVPTIVTLWERILTVIDDFSSADFNKVLVARQARRSLTVLTPSGTSEDVQGAAGIVDLLIIKSLLDVTALCPDYEAYKYSGYAVGAHAGYYDTLALAATPDSAYTAGPGDLVFNSTNNVLLGTVTAKTTTGYKLDPALVFAWAAAPGDSINIRGAGYTQYLLLVSAMQSARQSLVALTDNPIAALANAYAYSGSGSTQYAEAKLAIDTAITALSNALVSYTVGSVPEIVLLISSLREEKLLPVLSYVLSLDFQSILDLDTQQLSSSDAAAEIMTELANMLGADLPSLDIYEGTVPFSEYYDRPHDS